MTTINIPEERILSGCDRAIIHLNDLILFNIDLHERGKEIRFGEENVKSGKEIAEEYKEKRKPFYLIQAKARDGRELTEDDFNVVKKWL